MEEYFSTDFGSAIEYVVRVTDTDGEERMIEKPKDFPAIPNSEATSFWVDGARLLRTTNHINRHFHVIPSGLGIMFSLTQPYHKLELRWLVVKEQYIS